MLKKGIIACFLFLCSLAGKAQIEVDYLSLKEFKAVGFGGFLNFSFPVSDANYVTAELGLQYFKDKYDQEVARIPVLAGYRYTLNQSGTGLYIEPVAGYCFGESDVESYDEEGRYLGGYKEVKGPVAGINVGHLFEFTGKIQFNLAFRYEHTFSKAPTDLLGVRISHAITFGRKDRIKLPFPAYLF